MLGVRNVKIQLRREDVNTCEADDEIYLVGREVWGWVNNLFSVWGEYEIHKRATCLASELTWRQWAALAPAFPTRADRGGAECSAQADVDLHAIRRGTFRAGH